MKYHRNFPKRRLWHFFTIPFICSMIVPLIMLDIAAELYQRICFPCYKLACIRREKYIIIDRHRLRYLGFWNKIFCAYCGYANGLLAYVSAIAAATEGYFCSIQHKEKAGRHNPAHHKNFLKYGDKKSAKNISSRT